MAMDDPFERVNWIQMPQQGGWEYLLAHRSRHLWTVQHETFGICSSYHFGQTWKYRGQTHTLREPGLMLLEPGELHRTLDIPGAVTFKVALIPPDEVERAAFALGHRGRPHLRTAHSHSQRLLESVWRLGVAVESTHQDPLEIQCLQAEIINDFLELTETSRPSSAQRAVHVAVEKARRHLMDCVDESVTLERLESIAGISRYRLVSLFTRELGLSPHAYHLRVRILKAREMLKRKIPGTQVAADLGFVDQAHFIRHFKRVMRSTPTAYLREVTL